MNTPIHNALKYKNVCHYCKKEFMGKRQNMKVCYEMLCQRAHQNEKIKRRAEERRAKREAAHDGA